MEHGYKREFELIIQDLKEPDIRLRRNSAKKNLSRLDAPEFFEILVEALDAEDLWVKELAAGRLAKQNYEKAFQFLLDNLQNNRSSAAQHLGINKYKPAVKPLISILVDRTRPIWFRRVVAEAIGEIGDERAIQPLTQVYLDKTETEIELYWDLTVRYHAGESLSRFGEITIPIFLSASKDKDEETRLCAVRALGKLASHEAVPSLINLLQDEERIIGWAAVRSLGEIGDNRAIDPVFNVILNTKDRTMYENACIALGKLGDIRAVELLISILENQRIFRIARGNAAYLLGKLGDPRSYQPLIEALESKWGEVCGRAAEGLAIFGDTNALPNIQKVQENRANIRNYEREAEERVAKAIEILQEKLQEQHN